MNNVNVFYVPKNNALNLLYGILLTVHAFVEHCLFVFLHRYGMLRNVNALKIHVVKNNVRVPLSGISLNADVFAIKVLNVKTHMFGIIIYGNFFNYFYILNYNLNINI